MRIIFQPMRARHLFLTLVMGLLWWFGLGFTLGHAQEFTAPGTPPREASRAQDPRAQDGTPKPRPTGALVLIARFGLQALNPAYTAHVGAGTTLSANIEENRRIGDPHANDARRDFGGIRLFGLEW